MEKYSEMYQLLVEGLRKIYEPIINRIVVYGSVARGTQTEESDIDIAVLLEKEETEDMYDKMADLVVDLELAFDCVISLLTIKEEKFKKWENTMPFYKNIKKDGVVLWTAV